MPSEINLGSNFEVTFNEDSGTLVIEVDSDEIQADGIDLGDLNSLQLQDAAADPSANGEFQLNGPDAKVFSGGSARNLSNVGSGGGGLQDGDDFDGQGTSDFTDLNSLSTGDLSFTALKGGNLQQAPTDVSESRSTNTTYQNTGGYTLYIVLRLTADSGASSVEINGQFTSSQTSAGADDAANGLSGVNAVFDGGRGSYFTGLVPPDYYYRVRAFGDTGSYSINQWYEREMRE